MRATARRSSAACVWCENGLDRASTRCRPGSVGDRVEARLQGDWVEGTLEGEEPYAVQFDDGTIHNFEQCDLRPVSTYDNVMADPDLDPAFDSAGKNWCDWRTMSPLAIDCAPASYRVLVQDPQGRIQTGQSLRARGVRC